jgi:FAD/FMN-containing dehydrogenase/fatty acid desaturase
MNPRGGFFTAHPQQLFRRSRRFYLTYDLGYGALSVALGLAMGLSDLHCVVGAPTRWWWLLFPCAVYAVIVCHLCIHNAVHGNFPRALNRLLGELLGVIVVVRFASWVMVHLRHHRFSDDRRSDPHPNFPGFWTTVKHTLVHVERQLMQDYYDLWGDQPETRAAEALRAKLSYGTNVLVLVAWLVLLGPWFFGLIFLPANVLGALFIIHFNWTTHNGQRGEDFRPVNLNHGFFRLGNKIFAGIYMHANHHDRPHLFDPRAWDASRFGPAQPCVDAASGANGRAMSPARQSLSSYSRLRRISPAELHVPGCLEEVAALLGRAAREGRRATIRGAGRSFDDQALNDDLVIDVSGFDRILALDVTRREVTVQGGARWDAIMDASLEEGLIPHILVTTPGATAAGTLSANCLSRSTPRYGHTGDHVRSLSLLTVGGDILTCSRSENAELFRAVVGGFGYFGVVLQATYDLLHIGRRRNVKTVIERCEGLPAFTERLTEMSLDPAPYDGVYSVFSLAAPQRGAVLRSLYTEEPLRGTLHIHQPYSWYRPLAELLFLSSRISNAFCHASYKYVFGRGPFVDSLRGYTFCMEGNERAKAIADRVGISMTAIQHSYAVPTESFLAFLEDSARLFDAHAVYPCLLDAVYRPADDFLLSSANGLAGFCVTWTFEGVTRRKGARILRCLHELNEACLAAGGRLHLVKNVYATKEQLRRMYGHAIDDLARLKAQVDPRGVLMNDFFGRAFG